MMRFTSVRALPSTRASRLLRAGRALLGAGLALAMAAPLAAARDDLEQKWWRFREANFGPSAGDRLDPLYVESLIVRATGDYHFRTHGAARERLRELRPATDEALEGLLADPNQPWIRRMLAAEIIFGSWSTLEAEKRFRVPSPRSRAGR